MDDRCRFLGVRKGPAGQWAAALHNGRGTGGGRGVSVQAEGGVSLPLPGSDLEQFKKLVGSDGGVKVRIRDWYKQ